MFCEAVCLGVALEKTIEMVAVECDVPLVPNLKVGVNERALVTVEDTE